jgi:EAL domain-containing protein (putative c-di-GMP-specific phosphodiesterase class I)/GGDEF domain-containing protein
LFILWVLFFLASTPLHAIPPLNKVGSSSVYPVQPIFQIYEDEASEHTFETVVNVQSDVWQNMSTEEASFGFTTSPFWARTKVFNDSEQVKNFIIEVDYTLLDSVSFKAQKVTGEVFELSTGDNLPFYPRQVDHPGNLFRFQLMPHEELPIYMRVQTQGSLIIPLYLWEELHFFEVAAAKQKFHFFYFGAVSVIILLNFAVFFMLRERLYIYYATAITGYLVFFATSRGYIQQFFTSDAPELSSRLFLMSMPILALFSVLFARQFLRSAHNSPRLDIALKAMIGFEIFNLLLAIFGSYNMVVRVSALGAVLLFSVLFIAGPVIWSKRNRAGMYFTLAWTPLTVGFFATSGRTSGFLPNNFWTEYAMQIGSGIEAVVLTLALADRLYRERENKIRAQAESLRVEKQRNLTQSLLTEAMSRDSVTQLSNRNGFEWLVGNTINENLNKPYVLAVAKITRIDDITRTLGLSSAERILKHVASQLNKEHSLLKGVVSYISEKGEKESVFQLSRDTFGSFMELEEFEKDPQAFYDVLHRIAEPIDIEGISLDLSPMYGSAQYPKDGSEPAQLIRNAIIALQESRHSKEMMGVFDERLDIYDENRLTLLTQLREALENDDLLLFYQPKLDLNCGEVIGMEGLARWIHPTRGFIPPDEFIPLAEDAGFIHRLTLWAFERAVKDIEVLRESGYRGSVSVNISTRDLLIKSFSSDLGSILGRYSVPAEFICLELTETGAMEDPEEGIATLNSLAELGLKLAIDDFGTGYSSLSYLQRLPATEIKLDRSLIQDICTNESTAIIVKTSIDMVRALGYAIVAEGVEDEQTVDKLRDFNCDCLQGYWCCKPKPLAEIIQWLQVRNTN